MTEEKTRAAALSRDARKLQPAMGGPSYAQPADAARQKSPRETPLSSGWAMRIAAAADESLAAFFEPDFGGKDFENIEIPQRLFAAEIAAAVAPAAPEADEKAAPAAAALYYRCAFEQPALEEGVDYVLCAEGLLPRGEVFLNAQPLGEISDGYGLSEFLLNGLLKQGENVLALKLEAGAALADDWDARGPWGIVGGVSIARRARDYVADIYVKSARGESGGAQIECDVSFVLGAESDGKAGGELAFYIYDGTKQVAAETAAVKNAAPGRLGVARFCATLPKAKLWSPASPALYRAVAALKDAAGKTIDVRGCAFGINRVTTESKDENGAVIPYLAANGERLNIYGAEYYAYAGERGYATRESEIRAELGKLKDNGFNAVRLIAPDERALDICDELGLYVACEIPLALAKLTRRSRAASDPLRFGLARAASAVSLFKNHACVLMWSLGDCPSYARATIQNLIKTIDKTRPVVCDGDYSFTISDVFAALDCSMADLNSIAAGKLIFGAGLRPTLGYRALPFLLLGYAIAGEKTPSVAERYAVINENARLCGAFCERLDLGDDALLEQMRAAFLQADASVAEPAGEPELAAAGERVGAR